MTVDLTTGIIRILDSQGQTVGTGFVLTENGLIATCAHVIGFTGAGPGEKVHLAFHRTNDVAIATVERDGWRESQAEDIAILHLDGPLPPEVTPLPLGSSNGTANHAFETFGFPDANPDGGLVGGGQILGQTTYHSVRMLQLRSQEVTGGFSGAPVLDTERQQVIGMVTATIGPDQRGRLRDTAFITPIEDIVAACSTVGSALPLLLPPNTHAEKLATYRLRVLNDPRNKYINLTGIAPPGQAEQLSVELERVYIQLQAVAQETQRRQQEQEARNLADKVKANISKEKASHQSARTRTDQTEHGPIGILTILRVIGEELYRRGRIEQAEFRPQPVDPLIALQKERRLVILGAPGSGKSTLLRYLAGWAAARPDHPLPLLIAAREYADACTSGYAAGLRTFTLDKMSGGDPILRQALEAAVEREQVLWLVDALDEVSNWELRERIPVEVGQLPGQWVVTSRPVGYPGGLTGQPHFEILPLAPADVEQFLRDWLNLLAEQRNEPNGWTEVHLEKLQNQIAARPRLTPLLQNPLLLTFLVLLTVNRSDLELPDKRAGLYQQYIESLIHPWETRRSPYRQLGAPQPTLKLAYLEGEAATTLIWEGFTWLGWQLHRLYYGGQIHSGTLPTEDVLQKLLTGYLHRQGYTHPENLAATILRFWQEAGLLVTWPVAGSDFPPLTFRHLTFQEYAAACYLARAWQNDPTTTWNFIRSRLHLPTWREVFILLSHSLPSQESEQFLQKVLHAHSPYERELRRDLRLAAAFIADGAPVNDKLARHVLVKLVGLGRRAEKTYRLILGVTYFAGLLLIGSLLLIKANLLLIVLTMIGWTLLWWAGATRFGNLWRLLAWPTRLWVQANNEYDLLTEAGRLGDVRTVGPLLETLRDNNWKVRSVVSEALRQLGKGAVEPLLVALQDEDVRWTVAGVLGQLGDTRAVEPLLAALRDEDEDVRWAVAGALGQLGDTRAVEPLLVALRDEDEGVRRAVVEALGQLGDIRAVEPLLVALRDEDEDVCRAVTKALGQLGDIRAVEPLLVALRDEDELVQWDMSQALRQLIDTRSVEPLLVALRDSNAFVRFEAIFSLGKLGDTRAVEPLLKVLKDENEDKDIRQEAAKALAQLGNDRAAASLLAALRNENEAKDIRQAVASALGHLGSDWTAEALVTTLLVKDRAVRGAGMDALYFSRLAEVNDEFISRAPEILGYPGDDRAIEPRLSKDNDEFVRRVAEVLGYPRNDQAIESLLAALQDRDVTIRRVVVEVFGYLRDDRLVEALLGVLQDEDKDVRWAAANALREMRDVRAVEPLSALLQDEDEDVRWAAARALGQLGDTRAVEPLLATLRDEDVGVRWAVAEALRQLGDTRAVEPLSALLQDEDENVREAAARALGQLGDTRAVEPLLAMLRDEDGGVCWMAMLALKQIGDIRTVEPLLAALRDENKDIRKEAARALGQLGDTQAVEPLLAALQDEDKDIRKEAARALAQLGDDRAVKPLLMALRDEDKDIREEAVRALAQLGDDRVVEPLLAALRDKDAGVRWAVDKALSQVNERLDRIPALQRAQRAAWWALTDTSQEVRQQAYQILVNTTQRLTLVQGQQLPLQDVDLTSLHPL